MTTTPAPVPTLLRRARLIDVDGEVDLAIEGGRIAAIGTNLSVPPDTEVVDLAGRWVVPGLWDAHVHLLQHALAGRRLDVSGASSAREAAALVLDRAVSQGITDELLVGFGFRDAAWPDLPSRALLDDAAPGRAVVLVSGDLHCGWFSTAALERLDLDADESGLVREDDFLPVAPRLEQASDAERDSWVRAAAARAARRGVVGVVDLEADDPFAWSRRLAGRDDVALRVRAGVWPAYLDDVLARGLRTGDGLPGVPVDAVGAPLATVGPLKVITDGSLNTRTAFCRDPYPGGDDHGVLTWEPDALREVMTRATQGGLTCAIHAIGDHANALALDAFEATGACGSVEHAQLLDRADVGRFAALGVVASVQPAHLLDDRDVAEELWAGRTDRLYAFASLLDAGATLTLGSDAPVAALDPWLAIAAAVSRTADERPAWHERERLTARQALAASTDGAGVTPRVGEVADLAVVADDPLAGRTDVLVDGTLLAGVWTHREV